jgi:D-sedoheptulose 7-phosphate isomerase
MEALNRALTSIETTDAKGATLDFEEGARQAVQMLAGIAARGGKVLLVGNGGSAAIVSHMQNDLCKAAQIPALVFNEAALLTAYSNDDGYEVAFQKIAELWARSGDLLIAVSSSGRSRNILATVSTCLARGLEVISFSGFSPDNPLRGMGHLNFYVRAQAYGMVELAHGCLGHFLTDTVAPPSPPPAVPRRSSVTLLPVGGSRG